MPLPTREREEVKNEPHLDKFTITVKSLTGRIETYAVNKKTTVLELKLGIEERRGIPPDLSRLVFIDRQLGDDETMEYSKVGPGNTLHHICKLRGC